MALNFGEIVTAVLAGATFLFLVADRFTNWGRRTGRTDDVITALGEKIDGMETSITRYASAITANTEMGIRLTGRADEAERRIELVEDVKAAFIKHAATDVAEHASMRESIDRLTRSSEGLSAQISRITPADSFVEVSGRRRRVAGSD